MLLMVEKGIRGGICHVIHICAKPNKIIELSYLIYLDINNLYGWAMSQKLPVNGFN